MPIDAAVKQFEAAATDALARFQEEAASLRTGRVTPDLVATVAIEHYGAKTPLQGVASVANADARTLTITPWDDSAVPAIEQALTVAQVGAQPVVDGKVIRLSFPMLNEEMRAETIKTLHKKAEEARVRFRQARDEALSGLTHEKKEGQLSEDEFYRGKKELDQHIDERNKEVETVTKSKEEEIGTL